MVGTVIAIVCGVLAAVCAFMIGYIRGMDWVADNGLSWSSGYTDGVRSTARILAEDVANEKAPDGFEGHGDDGAGEYVDGYRAGYLDGFAEMKDSVVEMCSGLVDYEPGEAAKKELGIE